MNPFILQTAQDYDLEYNIVEYYYNNFRDNMYDKLEEYLKTRIL